MNPFEQLEKETIKELLEAIDKGFHKFKIGNIVKDDYTIHYPLYLRLVEYVNQNHQRIEYQYKLPPMPDNEFVTYLLKYELTKK